MIPSDALTAMVGGYCQALLFTESDHTRDDDKSLAVLGYKVSESLLWVIVARCERFSRAYPDACRSDPLQAGRDLYFTSHGHGVGFWDGDWDAFDADGMSELAREIGQMWYHVDRGYVHG